MQLPSRFPAHSSPLHSFDTSSTDEEYIDMDVNSTTFLCYSITSSPEFEFNMSLKDNKEYHSLTSPADELFYKGKLLPLHLPPRIQMVQKLLQACNEEKKPTPLSSKEATPFVTPSESRNVSGELNADECFYDCNTKSGDHGGGDDDSSFSNSIKKAWCKKLQLIKQASLGSRLKASKSYFRSLFRKQTLISDVSTESKREDHHFLDPDNSLKKKIEELCRNKCKAIVGKRKTSSEGSKNSRKSSGIQDTGHRRSFSDAINTSSSLSRANLGSLSSPSLASPGMAGSRFEGLPSFLKRSNSANSDVERSAQGAIAYCKQSQLNSRTANEVQGFFGLFSASRVGDCATKERIGLCRGCLFCKRWR